MSASNSNLTSASFKGTGYDFVVATTQESINATMIAYLHGLTAPEIIKCYIQDEDGNPLEMDYETLKKQTGVDPFAVKDAATDRAKDVKKLKDVYFWYGFKAKLGIPSDYNPLLGSLPKIVELGQTAAAIKYNLTCAEFQVVKCPIGRGKYLNKSQPGVSDMWTFGTTVDLRLSSANANYTNLPPAVKTKIKNLGPNAFSIEQLHFDLDNASLQSIPTINGVKAGTALYTALQDSFTGVYFNQLKKNGQPVLSYAIKTGKPVQKFVVPNGPEIDGLKPGESAPDNEPIDGVNIPTEGAVDFEQKGRTIGVIIPSESTGFSPFKLTDLNLEVNPFMDAEGNPVKKPTADQKALNTLCYLCATEKHSLPPAQHFDWNWLDASQGTKYHGAIAINRNTFAAQFMDDVVKQAKRNCYKPWIGINRFNTDYKYNWGAKSNQEPSIDKPATGKEVLKVSYSANSQDKVDVHEASLNTSYNLTMEFVKDTIIIKQHLKFNLSMSTEDSAYSDCNIVDKQITDTYTLLVAADGHLTFKLSTNTIDNSTTLESSSMLKFLPGEDWKQQSAKAKAWIDGLIETSFKDIKLDFVQNFIFPGGKTFMYKDVNFSDHQDLVSYITYLDSF